VRDLTELARRVRAHPGLIAKRDLRHVAEIVGGDGDDAALINIVDRYAGVLAAEAIRPELIAAEPRVAGIAGVVTVLNDLAATGAHPMAILDTVVGSDAVVRGMLEGIAAAADLYRVPVVGGHTTVRDGDPALSTFAVGWAGRPLRAQNAREGDPLCLLICRDGELVQGPDGSLIFSHLRGRRRAHAADDLALLPAAAETGEAWAARDVSMPGVIGSLLQFLESAGSLGCVMEVDAIPVPTGVDLGDWLVAFPSYAFLLCGDPERLARRFAADGLVCTQIGVLDATGSIRLRDGGAEIEVWDLKREPLASLSCSPDR
jgi:selenophosphate synthetase-related protein